MKGTNPYKLPAGRELDRLIDELLFENQSEGTNPPAYSTDDRAADKVKARLKSLGGHSVVTGTTRLREKPFFARYDTGPSTSTEVLAETYPLAICRLAMLVTPGREKRA